MSFWTIVGHWSYTGDPELSSRDKVRWYTGDTDATDQLVSDEEIDSALDETGTAYGAASVVCRAIAARFARLVTKSTAGQNQTLTNNLSDLHKHYLDLAEQMSSSASSAVGAGLYAGGISISDKQSNEDDTDWVPPDFHREMLDAIGTLRRETADAY